MQANYLPMLFFNKDYNKDLSIHKADLLLAEPFLDDTNFGRSVVLVCEHQEEGSFGLILNKPSDTKLGEVLDLDTDRHQLYVGGPVEQNSLHFIHQLGQIEGSIPLRNGVYWGGNFEQIRFYIENGVLTEKNCRFFVGYSGWGKNQLYNELRQNSWIISQYNLAKIYETPAQQLWRHILYQMGGNYKALSNFPTDPRLN